MMIELSCTTIFIYKTSNKVYTTFTQIYKSLQLFLVQAQSLLHIKVRKRLMINAREVKAESPT